jgi:hypothetical protein
MVERKFEGKRMRWDKRILQWLKTNGAHFPFEIMKELNVPEREKRSFYRAIERLIDLEVVTKQDDGKIARVGYENPEKLSISIGPRPLRISLPIPTGTAKRILEKRWRVKSILLKRKGPAYEVLSELGILD